MRFETVTIIVWKRPTARVVCVTNQTICYCSNTNTHTQFSFVCTRLKFDEMEWKTWQSISFDSFIALILHLLVSLLILFFSIKINCGIYDVIVIIKALFNFCLQLNIFFQLCIDKLENRLLPISFDGSMQNQLKKQRCCILRLCNFGTFTPRTMKISIM